LSLFTPVVGCDAAAAGKTVHLKLENLQPVASFKIRPIGNAVLVREPAELSSGIYTASTGNSAIGVAFMARRLGIPATAVVPENAPQAKLEKLRHLGARVEMRSAAEWWNAIRACGLEGQQGLYIDAVRDPAALAGDATLGLEILEQLPDVEAILIPFGGGGLACGHRLRRARARTQGEDHRLRTRERAPLEGRIRGRRSHRNAAFDRLRQRRRGGHGTARDVAAGEIPDRRGHHRLARGSGRGDQSHGRAQSVVAEGAGAVSVAAALSGRYAATKVCAVVSGGNLDSSLLATILGGGVPA